MVIETSSVMFYANFTLTCKKKVILFKVGYGGQLWKPWFLFSQLPHMNLDGVPFGMNVTS